MAQRSPLSWFLIWLACFCLFTVFLASLTNLPSFWSLIRNYKVASGEVIDIQKGNHGAVEIRYKVGQLLVARTFPHYAGAMPGATVPVYYSPQDPRNATLSPPSEFWAVSFPLELVFALVLSILLTIGILRFDSRHYLVSV